MQLEGLTPTTLEEFKEDMRNRLKKARADIEAAGMMSTIHTLVKQQEDAIVAFKDLQRKLKDLEINSWELEDAFEEVKDTFDILDVMLCPYEECQRVRKLNGAPGLRRYWRCRMLTRTISSAQRISSSDSKTSFWKWWKQG